MHFIVDRDFCVIMDFFRELIYCHPVISAWTLKIRNQCKELSVLFPGIAIYLLMRSANLSHCNFHEVELISPHTVLKMH